MNEVAGRRFAWHRGSDGLSNPLAGFEGAGGGAGAAHCHGDSPTTDTGDGRAAARVALRGFDHEPRRDGFSQRPAGAPQGDRIDADDLPVLQGERCASVGGVSVHANVAVPARDRRRLERLCRYGARPPVATERLSRLDDGRLLYRLKHRWRDGTTHVVFTPQELVEKLAALVPPPRFHLVRYHGVLGPCASERDRIVPAGLAALPAQSASTPESASRQSRADGDPTCAASSATPDAASIEILGSMPERELLASPATLPADSAGTPPQPDAARARRLAWAELMKRVFAIDVLECPRCRGPMRILGAIEPPETTSAILACLGLPVRAPPLAPARRDDGFDDEAADPSPADFES